VFPASVPPGSEVSDPVSFPLPFVDRLLGPERVGIRPMGAGRWGHLDAAKNVDEVLLDHRPADSGSRVDRVLLNPDVRLVRGGFGWRHMDADPSPLRLASRHILPIPARLFNPISSHYVPPGNPWRLERRARDVNLPSPPGPEPSLWSAAEARRRRGWSTNWAEATDRLIRLV
jgi:hypothetical protein